MPQEGFAMSSKIVTGGCFCGAVRYTATSAPLASMVCHCQSCRRIAASPVVAWITFQKVDFQITSGAPSEFRSSPGVRRTFCATCGTPLTYENAKWPTETDVTTCSLDRPEEFPPRHHSWLSQNVSWVHFGDGLPSYPESRDAGGI